MPNIPDITTYVDADGTQYTKNENHTSNYLDIIERNLVSLVIGKDIESIRCHGNQIKNLYIPKHMDSICVDHDQNITNLNDVIGSKIYVNFIHHEKDKANRVPTAIERLREAITVLSKAINKNVDRIQNNIDRLTENG